MSTNFTQSEIEAVKKALYNRWQNKDVEIHLADLEIVKENKQETKSYPALIWEESNSTFIIIKVGVFTYKSFFYYAQEEQRYDTGVNKYNDLYECANKLLKAQANFVLARTKKND